MKKKTETSVVMSFRFDPDEIELAKESAKKLGIDLAEYVREHLRELAKYRHCPTCGSKLKIK